jgi:lipopolysaccharide/colanic/teichoic acid biosynthesis glycosyltransferase
MTVIVSQAGKSATFTFWRGRIESGRDPGVGDIAGPYASQPTREQDSGQSGLAYGWSGEWPSLPAQSGSRSRTLIAKRVIDIVLAGGALFALLPLLVLTALAIKLTSKGPVFFRQHRPGLNGRPFEMLKFRTMFTDAGDASGIKQTEVNDARITPLGKFLRAKSIDELPQLINVLRGDMSIIGPRPHVAGMLAAGMRYEELVPYYHLRHMVRPGLSGWAQANGLRGPTTDAVVARARIDHDIAYIQNLTVLLDIRIIVQTLQREFFTGSGL